MTTLLNVRLIQLKRDLGDSGPGVLLMFSILLLLIGASYTIYQKTPDAFYLTTFLFYSCLSLQVFRKDKLFVYSTIENPRLELYRRFNS